MPVANAADRLLLVEGRDEEYVVKHLRSATKPMPWFGVEDKRGVDNVLKSISVEIKNSGRKAVGILADANSDPHARWQAVADRLKEADVVLPDDPDPNGTIVQENHSAGLPRVGVWLMPDNIRPGELEDFIGDMIPEGDPVWPLSCEYIAGIPQPRKFSDGKVRRAEVHAWLATRQKPRPMGLAIRAKDLDIESDTCRRFVRWLRCLFEEPASTAHHVL